MSQPRQAQVAALDFIWDAMVNGYEDIVISAPTGIGKTGIGAAACFWASGVTVEGWDSGGYYLVTQKMLQEQLERDFPRFTGQYSKRAAGIRSASDYSCEKFGTCGIGGKMTKEKRCANRNSGTLNCPYLIARKDFVQSAMAVTNYPFLFTEHTYVGKLGGRVCLVADECHTVERQIINFVELVIGRSVLEAHAPHLHPLPGLDTAEEFIDWCSGVYTDALTERMDMLTANLEASGYKNQRMLVEFNQLENHCARVRYVIDQLSSHPEDWVYWQESADGGLQCNAKPISAHPFVPKLLGDMAACRLYMSAYPGPKPVFCRSLGLDPKRTAWLDLDSPFPVENRPINIFPVGSMGRQSLGQTMPGMLKTIDGLLDLHAEHKGIIHCHSYTLGKQIYESLLKSQHGVRVIFPLKANDRRQALETHIRSKSPTVLISPSMTEGYSFDDDMARFQIIAKVPYPYLGDRQVAAKKAQDPDWYILQTAMVILQACGRIVRSETDYGHTYILDSDFVRLTEQHPQFFPDWLTKSFVYL